MVIKIVLINNHLSTMCCIAVPIHPSPMMDHFCCRNSKGALSPFFLSIGMKLWSMRWSTLKQSEILYVKQVWSVLLNRLATDERTFDRYYTEKQLHMHVSSIRSVCKVIAQAKRWHFPSPSPYSLPLVVFFKGGNVPNVLEFIVLLYIVELARFPMLQLR